MRKSRSTYPLLAALFCLALEPGMVVAQNAISDVSDAVFTIVVPSSAAREVDMGVLAVGAQRDSVVAPFIGNTGRARVRINTLRIEGADASAFAVIAGQGPVYVPVADGHPVGFAFRPVRSGTHSATIVIETQIDTQYYAIRGEAVAPALALDALMIDFGALPLGASRDSTLVLIRNLGAAPVQVTDARQGGPDLTQFEIIGGAAPFSIPPLGTHAMTLRYTAGRTGRASGSVEFTADGLPDRVRAQLFGEGVARDALATLATDTITAAAGELVRVPIRLCDARDVLFTGARAFSTELRYHASLLVPVGATPEGRLDGDERVITFDQLPLMPDGDGVLEYFDFIATLGTTEATPLLLTRSSAIGAAFPVHERPGMFRLADICREGGERFFDASGRLRLEPNRPNPFNATTVITFETIEHGYTELDVRDLLGRRVAILLRGPLAAGVHTAHFDAGNLASGRYLCILRTPSATLQRVLTLMK